jgi:polyisoprenoid-binding protein YceI
MDQRMSPLIQSFVATLLVAQSAVAQRPVDSAAYAVLPTSNLLVHTGTAGILGFAGHEHRVRARGFSGTIVYAPGQPAGSHVEVLIFTDSLQVLTPPDPEEIRKVTEVMRSEVLDVPHHPFIRFESSSVVEEGKGSRVRVRGALTLVGTTREIAVEMTLHSAGDTLRATGSFDLNQTDFGIKPYRGGPGGTVRVADRVTFELDVIAVRREDR